MTSPRVAGSRLWIVPRLKISKRRNTTRSSVCEASGSAPPTTAVAAIAESPANINILRRLEFTMTTSPAHCVLLDDDLDATVALHLLVVRGRDQQPLLATTTHRDRRRRHAVAHQGILDGVGAPQRQRHVVGRRTVGVGLAA